MSKRGIVFLLIFVGVFYLMLNSMMDGGAYFLTVDEVQAARQKGILSTGRKVRIKGILDQLLSSTKTKTSESGSSQNLP